MAFGPGQVGGRKCSPTLRITSSWRGASPFSFTSVGTTWFFTGTDAGYVFGTCETLGLSAVATVKAGEIAVGRVIAANAAVAGVATLRSSAGTAVTTILRRASIAARIYNNAAVAFGGTDVSAHAAGAASDIGIGGSQYHESCNYQGSFHI